jgi:hypothetical protein
VKTRLHLIFTEGQVFRDVALVSAHAGAPAILNGNWKPPLFIQKSAKYS